LIISYLATFLGTNSLYVLMCRKAVNQSINQSINHENAHFIMTALYNFNTSSDTFKACKLLQTMQDYSE